VKALAGIEKNASARLHERVGRQEPEPFGHLRNLENHGRAGDIRHAANDLVLENDSGLIAAGHAAHNAAVGEVLEIGRIEPGRPASRRVEGCEPGPLNAERLRQQSGQHQELPHDADIGGLRRIAERITKRGRRPDGEHLQERVRLRCEHQVARLREFPLCRCAQSRVASAA
jgi:hypothetical protein